MNGKRAKTLRRVAQQLKENVFHDSTTTERQLYRKLKKMEKHK